jgi:coenzyme PQQ precursor peptide PqqA
MEAGLAGNTAAGPDHNGLTPSKRNTAMAWTTPTLVEICIGLEINGYLPAEF